MTVARATLNPADPYALGELPSWRVSPGFLPLPAKGARVGIRDARGAGEYSTRFGWSWTPGTVEQLTERALVLRSPKGFAMSFELCDPWLVRPAEDDMFWKRCWACRGIGETVMPGSDFLATCVECHGWIDTWLDVWRAPRRKP